MRYPCNDYIKLLTQNKEQRKVTYNFFILTNKFNIMFCINFRGHVDYLTEKNVSPKILFCRNDKRDQDVTGQLRQ